MKKNITEVELANIFTKFLGGMDVYPEVEAGGGFIDIIGVNTNNDIFAVEVKKIFNFKLLEQGIRAKKYAHYVYVAIPYTKDLEFRIRLCKDYGIGVLILRPNGRIDEILKPCLNQKIQPLLLSEHQKKSIAGSQHDRITSFGITNINIVNFLKENNGIYDAKLLLENVKHHYSSNKSALYSIKSWINKGVITSFKYNDKHFILK